MRVSIILVMDIPEYERRHNANVEHRMKELQKLLESSGSSKTALNDLILGQSAACIRPLNQRGEGGCSARKEVNWEGFAGPLCRSERHKRTNGGDGADVGEHTESAGSRSRCATSGVQVHIAALSPLHIYSFGKQMTSLGNCSYLHVCHLWTIE